MKKYLVVPIFGFLLLMLAACEYDTDNAEEMPVRISSQQARYMMANNDVVIVDVRNYSEFEEGHIQGAVLIPVGDIETLAPLLLRDKDKILLVYCRSGNRSHHAARALVEMGFTAVYDFGGILDWDGDIVN